MGRTGIFVGSRPRFHCTFRQNGALADPSTVELRVRDPAGTVVTYTYPSTLARDSLGVFSRNVEITAEGTWWWKWFATGLGESTDADSFTTELDPF